MDNKLTQKQTTETMNIVFQTFHEKNYQKKWQKLLEQQNESLGVFVLIKIWYLVKCWEREMGSFKG